MSEQDQTYVCCICGENITSSVCSASIEGRAHSECSCLAREMLDRFALQLAREEIAKNGIPKAVLEQNKKIT